MRRRANSVNPAQEAVDALPGIVEDFIAKLNESGGPDAIVAQFQEWHAKRGRLVDEYVREHDDHVDDMDQFTQKLEAWLKERGMAT